MKIYTANNLLSKLFNLARWLAWDFSGIRFVYRKLIPEHNNSLNRQGYRAPSTFFIWFVSIYFAAFALINESYNNDYSKLEKNYAFIVSLLDTSTPEYALPLVSRTLKMDCGSSP